MTLAIVQTKDIFIQTNGELIPKKEERVKTEKTALLEPQIAKQRSKKNQEILMFTCTAFFLFAMAEVVGAIASNSLSLLGDAGAMSIDVFTVNTSFFFTSWHKSHISFAMLDSCCH